MVKPRSKSREDFPKVDPLARIRHAEQQKPSQERKAANRVASEAKEKKAIEAIQKFLEEGTLSCQDDEWGMIMEGIQTQNGKNCAIMEHVDGEPDFIPLS